ncbi:MAG TPA: 6-phosphogluconolactonase [Acidimicrobiia bacterium]|jgi:glucosamine-6-phosphate deaminase|nr:6-phosphogluconolactonase [Acidimicrobiia bacterium]
MEELRLLHCTDGAALAEMTAGFVSEALAAHPGRFVALAVGDSTLPLYARLDAADPGWQGRAITPVDELVPPPADPERRFSARLAAALPDGLRGRLVPIEVDAPDRRGADLDPPDRRSGDLDAADRRAADLDAADRRAADLDDRLRSDGLAAVVLGLGPDGHIAFNQPPTPVDAPARVVGLASANLARLGPVAPSRSALTMGVATILAAGSVLVVVAGRGKAEALDRLLAGPEDPTWPVTWLRRHPRLTVAATSDAF